MDEELERYCNVFMGREHLKVLIYLDIQDLEEVYEWRDEQGQRSRQRTGAGCRPRKLRLLVS